MKTNEIIGGLAVGIPLAAMLLSVTIAFCIKIIKEALKD